jgi:uncharacterized oxidoreductase
MHSLTNDGMITRVSLRKKRRAGGGKVTIHPEDLPKLLDLWWKLLASGEPGEIEARLRRHDGIYRWFLFRVETLRDEFGKVLRWYGTNTDIDDLKQAQVKLRQNEEELRRIIDAIPQTIVVLNPNGRAIDANRVALEYTGLSLDEVRAENFRERIFHPEDIERLRAERQGALSNGVPFENEQRAVGKDGKYRWFLNRYNPFRDEQGRLVRWYATGTEIDDRKRSEDRLRTENLALREELDHSAMFEEIVGSGIGRGLAEALHKLGNKVIISGRRRSHLDATTKANPGMASVELDIENPASITKVAESLKKDFRGLNVLINNAGIMQVDDAAGPIDDALLVSTVTTNLLGPIRLTSALIDHLKKQPAAVVIYNSSVLGFVPLALTAVYSSTKAALHSYVLSQRYKLKGSSVRVLEMAPPWVQTDLLGSNNEPRAMPLAEFIAETIKVLGTDAEEDLVERAKPLRNNVGPNEGAFVTQFNDMMLQPPA